MDCEAGLALIVPVVEQPHNLLRLSALRLCEIHPVLRNFHEPQPEVLPAGLGLGQVHRDGRSEELREDEELRFTAPEGRRDDPPVPLGGEGREKRMEGSFGGEGLVRGVHKSVLCGRMGARSADTCLRFDKPRTARNRMQSTRSAADRNTDTATVQKETEQHNKRNATPCPLSLTWCVCPRRRRH